MNIEMVKEILMDRLSEKRYIHSLGVQKTAISLAKQYNGSVEKASIAGLVHDCAKNFSNDELLAYAVEFNIPIDPITKCQQQLLHGLVGAALAKKEFGITDEEVLKAIRFHTTGKEDMTLLEKIIYLADYIEPNRDFEGVEVLRKVALVNLDKATLMAFDNTINYVISKGELLHPSTISARNFLLIKDQGVRLEA